MGRSCGALGGGVGWRVGGPAGEWEGGSKPRLRLGGEMMVHSGAVALCQVVEQQSPRLHR